jgi:hypothetical protein
MALPDGTLTASFDSGVKRLLTATNLLKEPITGRNRGIYSCRHSYATWQIAAKRNPQELARNMGTSLAMFERSYHHFIAIEAADRLTDRL